MLVFVKGQGMIFVAHVIKQSTGREIIFFFSESHLAPKFFKVVAFATSCLSLKAHFQRQTRPFLRCQRSR